MYSVPVPNFTVMLYERSTSVEQLAATLPRWFVRSGVCDAERKMPVRLSNLQADMRWFQLIRSAERARTILMKAEAATAGHRRAIGLFSRLHYDAKDSSLSRLVYVIALHPSEPRVVVQGPLTAGNPSELATAIDRAARGEGAPINVIWEP